MAQEVMDPEDSRWLRELRSEIGDELVDVRCVRVGEGYDFLLVYSPGYYDTALERFVEAFKRAPDIPPIELMSYEDGRVPDYCGDYKSIATGKLPPMAQEQIHLEGSRWLTELQAALGDELVDVCYSIEGEGIDFLLVYAEGARNAAGQLFTEALLKARDIPPFESISFEQGKVPGPFDQYRSIRALARAG